MMRTTKPRPSISLWRMRQEKATPDLLVRGPRARNDASAPGRVAGRTVRFGPGTVPDAARRRESKIPVAASAGRGGGIAPIFRATKMQKSPKIGRNGAQ